MKAAVIYGSVRSHRQGIRAARFVARQLELRGHEVHFVDPLEYRLPLLERRYSEYEESEAPEPMRRLSALLGSSDALIFVTGEYNHGVPPALKNLIDHFAPEYRWRVAAIASYSAGGFGGIRAALQLRTILAGVGLMTMPQVFPMSTVHKSFNEDGEALDEAYATRIPAFLQELEWYAAALAAARSKGLPAG